MQFYRKHLVGKKIRYILVLVILNIFFGIQGLQLQTNIVHAQGTIASEASIRATGAAVCASPPANFNVLTASDNDILYYGLPKRDPKNLSHWAQLAQGAKHRGCSSISEKHSLRKPVDSVLSPNATKFAAHPNSTQAYYSSTIWSGYVVGDGTPKGFKAVEGYWHNPCLTSAKTPTGSQMAIWVGIGGWENDNSQYSGDLWQAGSEVETGGPYESGSPSHPVYHMWHETYPTQDWILDSRNLSCSDLMFGYVDYNDTVAGDNYYFVDDETNGDYIADYIVPGALQVPDVTWAEWIDERPSCPYTSAYHQLPDFNYMEWRQTLAIPNGSTNYGKLNDFYNTQATMKEHNSPYYNLTNPGSIGSDGESFNDNFANNGNGNDNSC